MMLSFHSTMAQPKTDIHFNVEDAILTLVDMPWIKFMTYVAIVLPHYLANGWGPVGCYHTNIHSTGKEVINTSPKSLSLHRHRTCCLCNLRNHFLSERTLA